MKKNILSKKEYDRERYDRVLLNSGRERNRKYRAKLRGTLREYDIWMKLKCKSKHEGKEFDLSVEDIVIPKVCPILGIQLDVLAKRPSGNCLSVDRIDNSKGYVKGNVCIVSYKANLMKRDNTIESLKSILKYMEAHLV